MNNDTRAIRVQPELQQSIAFGAIGAGYTLIGRLANPSRMFEVYNLTDGLMQFSLDGINAHFVVPVATSIVRDICANQTFGNGGFIAQGTPIYVRYLAAPTTGNVYISSWYGSTI